MNAIVTIMATRQQVYEKAVLDTLGKLYSDPAHDVLMDILRANKEDPVIALVKVSNVLMSDLPNLNISTTDYLIPIVSCIAEMAQSIRAFEMDVNVIKQAIEQLAQKHSIKNRRKIWVLSIVL
jgi:hypothetical protein